MLENRCDCGRGLALRIHVHMGVNVHGDLGAVVAGELLHHLGVDSVDGEQGQVGMAELVEAPVVQTILRPVLSSPTAEARGQHAGAAVVGNDRAVVGLLDVSLLRLAPLVGAGVALELSLLVGLENFDRLVREGRHARAGLGLGGLEVSHVVVGVANVGYLAVEVNVAPRETTDLATAQAHGDGKKIGTLAVGLGVERLDELVRLGGSEGTLGLGVPKAEGLSPFHPFVCQFVTRWEHATLRRWLTMPAKLKLTYALVE